MNEINNNPNPKYLLLCHHRSWQFYARVLPTKIPYEGCDHKSFSRSSGSTTK